MDKRKAQSSAGLCNTKLLKTCCFTNPEARIALASETYDSRVNKKSLKTGSD